MDAFISKLSASGEIEWQKRLGGSGSDQLEEIIQTRDGGYAAAGWSNSVDGDAAHGRGTLWVIRLDDTGRVEWGRRYGGSCGEIALSIIQTSDGGFAAAGQTCSSDGDVKGYHKAVTVNGDTLDDAWVIKLDSVGNLQWQKCVGGSWEDGAGCIIQARDSGLLFVGATQSVDGDLPDTNSHRRSHTGMADVWIVKLEDTGSLLWQRTYGGSFGDNAYSVLNDANGGFTVFCQANSTDGDVACHGVNAWILHLDLLGDLASQDCLTFPSGALAEIFPSLDGGFIAAGDTVEGPTGLPIGAWIAKFSDSAFLLWQKTLWGGGSGNDDASSAIEAPDGSILFVGGADTRYQGGEVTGLDTTGDAWVVKLAPESSGVTENTAPPPSEISLLLAHGTLWVSSPASMSGVVVYDVLGRAVASSVLRESRTASMDVGGLPAGVYFVRVTLGTGEVRTIKLVKE